MNLDDIVDIHIYQHPVEFTKQLIENDETCQNVIFKLGSDAYAPYKYPKSLEEVRREAMAIENDPYRKLDGPLIIIKTHELRFDTVIDGEEVEVFTTFMGGKPSITYINRKVLGEFNAEWEIERAWREHIKWFNDDHQPPCEQMIFPGKSYSARKKLGPVWVEAYAELGAASPRIYVQISGAGTTWPEFDIWNENIEIVQK